MEFKQLIIVRQDLQLPKGKLAAQCAHAAVEAAWRAPKESVRSWRDQGMGKVVLKVPDEQAMIAELQRAKDAGFPTALITDAGKTVVAPGTRTCIAIGPAASEDLDKYFSALKLL